MNAFTSIYDSMTCTNLEHLVLNFSTCQPTALALQLLLKLLCLRHSLWRTQTICHAPNYFCDLASLKLSLALHASLISPESPSLYVALHGSTVWVA